MDEEEGIGKIASLAASVTFKNDLNDNDNSNSSSESSDDFLHSGGQSNLEELMQYNVYPTPPVCSLKPSREHLSYTHYPMLHNGARFKGEQSGTSQKCPVEVVIEHVDYESCTLCGRLTIGNLNHSGSSTTTGTGSTSASSGRQSDITTFFVGEIICERNPFLTRKWDADEEIDRKHWSKFTTHFKSFEQTFNADSFRWDRLSCCGAIFMRWKEVFVVPLPSSNSAGGSNKDKDTEQQQPPCSFTGFYYICMDKSKGNIEGYYFHKSAHDSSYQSLMLDYKPQSTSGIFNIR